MIYFLVHSICGREFRGPNVLEDAHKHMMDCDPTETDFFILADVKVPDAANTQT